MHGSHLLTMFAALFILMPDLGEAFVILWTAHGRVIGATVLIVGL